MRFFPPKKTADPGHSLAWDLLRYEMPIKIEIGEDNFWGEDKTNDDKDKRKRAPTAVVVKPHLTSCLVQVTWLRQAHYRNLAHFYIHFRWLFTTWKTIEWLTNPSLFCTITEKSNQACGSTVRLGLQGGQVPDTVPGLGVFAMAIRGQPQTYSLECTSPNCNCTLGDNGAR